MYKSTVDIWIWRAATIDSADVLHTLTCSTLLESRKVDAGIRVHGSIWCPLIEACLGGLTKFTRHLLLASVVGHTERLISRVVSST